MTVGKNLAHSYQDLRKDRCRTDTYEPSCSEGKINNVYYTRENRYINDDRDPDRAADDKPFWCSLSFFLSVRTQLPSRKTTRNTQIDSGERTTKTRSISTCMESQMSNARNFRSNGENRIRNFPKETWIDRVNRIFFVLDSKNRGDSIHLQSDERRSEQPGTERDQELFVHQSTETIIEIPAFYTIGSSDRGKWSRKQVDSISTFFYLYCILVVLFP